MADAAFGLWPLVVLIYVYVRDYMYVRLARSEEREVAARFGEAWAAYAARTPAFRPRLGPARRTGGPARVRRTCPPPGGDPS
ncbi:hypothetical protein [Streptomyces sp. NPDC059071]|uniref:hypothetical protein n=1 Tax=unclassified Streptomyces TaxID=2593676 RepID=UPI003630F9F0